MKSNLLQKILLLSLAATLTTCEKKRVYRPDPAEQPEGTCIVSSNTRSEGVRYDFVYEESAIIGITGFNDFDTFIYDGELIRRANNSKDRSYSVIFDYTPAKQLNKITFEGVDSQNKKFSHVTTLTRNASGQVETMKLGLPIFGYSTDLKFSYDTAGNLKVLSAYLEGQWQTILENTSFDEKSSPFLNQQIGQIMSYFMAYAALTGGSNLSAFINRNNVLTSRMKNGNTLIYLTNQHQYNEYGYPLKTEISRTVNNRTTNSSEYFAYKCKK